MPAVENVEIAAGGTAPESLCAFALDQPPQKIARIAAAAAMEILVRITSSCCIESADRPAPQGSSKALLGEPIENDLRYLFVFLVQIHRMAVARQADVREINMIGSQKLRGLRIDRARV